MGIGLTHAVIHNVLSGISLEAQCSSFRGTVWKSSSSSSYSEHSGVLAAVLSSVELNDSCLCTGLGGVCGVFHGVTGAGSNEACSMLETWWIIGVFLNGVGRSTVSAPLSYPSSASDSCWSKAAFSVITKHPNYISSDC